MNQGLFSFFLKQENRIYVVSCACLKPLSPLGDVTLEVTLELEG